MVSPRRVTPRSDTLRAMFFKKFRKRLKIRFGPGGRRIIRLHDDLQGLIFVEESAWLFHAARGRKRIVEIGSFRGKSCVILACGAEAVEGRVTAIDPHQNLGSVDKTLYGQADADEFYSAIARHNVAHRVTKLKMTSAEALTRWKGEPIDLLWIDGDHSYEGIRFDLEKWSPLVRVGGIVAAHDYAHLEEVRRAWREVIESSGLWGPTGFVRSIAWAERRASAAGPDT